MITLNIPTEVDTRALAEYCGKAISPQTFQVHELVHGHDRLGGPGWSLYSRDDTKNPYKQLSLWCLDVDSEHDAVLIKLKYGI